MKKNEIEQRYKSVNVIDMRAFTVLGFVKSKAKNNT